ncbi:MAG: HAD-IC family P-type ATPase [Oscillospiraceae bacterium]|jgi:cation-transporting ATPase E|nr:HAD-IC family P-type ATPase [Oscillospiraceae bacterium]
MLNFVWHLGARGRNLRFRARKLLALRCRDQKIPLPQEAVAGVRLLGGLTIAHVEKRQKANQVNENIDYSLKKLWVIVAKNVFSLFNLILFGVALALFAVGSYKNLLFLGVVLSNIFVGLLQELRARRLLKKLSFVRRQTESVVRCGVCDALDSEKLVVDDIVFCSAGQQILVDGCVRFGRIEVNEASISGESEPVRKRRGDVLLSGSLVLSGACLMQVLRVGEQSYINQLARNAQKYRSRDSALIREIRLVIRTLSLFIAPFGALLFLQQYKIAKDMVGATEATAAFVISVLPEGLVLLTSVALFSAAWRLGKEKILVQELSGLETLSAADVICLDKTGTLTEDTQELVGIECGIGVTSRDVDEVLANLVSALADVTNQTFCGIKNYIAKKRKGIVADWQPQKITRFSSVAKWSGVVFESKGAFLLGAPEVVLGSDYEQHKEQIEAHMNAGARVVVLAASHGELGNLGEVPVMLALLVFRAKIRDNAARIVGFLQKRKAAIKILSGDSALTVAQIAKTVGVVGSERVFDAATLRNDASIAALAGDFTVFGRLTPEHKKELVQAWRGNGTVAMLGDGINDVLALKEADCSIAFGGGSAPARNVSHIVLLLDDFAALPKIIVEGQRIKNNIQRCGTMFLTKALFSLLVAFFLLFLPYEYPFDPIHMTLINAFTVGIPAFFLSFERGDGAATTGFLAAVLPRVLPGALCMVASFFVACPFGRCSNFLSAAQVLTVCVGSVGFVNLCLLYQICAPLTPLRGCLLLFASLGFVGFGICLQGFFGFEFGIRPMGLLLAISVGILCVLQGIQLLWERWQK